MKNFKIHDYQIKTSKTGNPIPVVNEIHLHSVYNPIKEANGLIQNNKDVFKKNKNILILGLGFAYHIHVAIAELEKNHKNFKIVVIEPNHQIYTDAQHYNPINSDKVKIYSESEISKLYKNIELVDFLSERPGVLAHPASFNLNDVFYRNFLTFKADQNLGSIVENLQNYELTKFCKTLNQNLTLTQNLENYITEKNQISSNMDHLIMAYKSLITPTLADQKEDR